MFWYEDEVKRLEATKNLTPQSPNTIFYGSSSIRLWENLAHDFADYNPMNLGFGGSTLAACAWYFERVFNSLHPTSIIVYAGDNDLGDGRHPEEVFLFFKGLCEVIRKNYGDIPLAFISIKPSISRWDIVENIRYTNKIIAAEIEKMGVNTCYINMYDRMTDKLGYPKREYFAPDGLHLNEQGYVVWKETIMSYVTSGALKLQ
jgi:lysophospholipase L1-like esterase